MASRDGPRRPAREAGRSQSGPGARRESSSRARSCEVFALEAAPPAAPRAAPRQPGAESAATAGACDESSSRHAWGYFIALALKAASVFHAAIFLQSGCIARCNSGDYGLNFLLAALGSCSRLLRAACAIRAGAYGRLSRSCLGVWERRPCPTSYLAGASDPTSSSGNLGSNFLSRELRVQLPSPRDFPGIPPASRAIFHFISRGMFRERLHVEPPRARLSR